MLAGTSLDQLYAQQFGQDTPIPSMQLCIENVDQAGGCAYGYCCAYTDTISWASPSEPLPMIRDPRAVFDQLFGVGATPPSARSAAADRPAASSTGSAAKCRALQQGPRRRRSRSASIDYLDDVREIERRIQKIEAQNSSGEVRELPDAPIGVPDSFDEHVKLMFDLQVLAFASDIDARVLVQDGPRRLERASIRRAASTARSTPRRTTASAKIASPTSRRSTAITSAWFRIS